MSLRKVKRILFRHSGVWTWALGAEGWVGYWGVGYFHRSETFQTSGAGDHQRAC